MSEGPPLTNVQDATDSLAKVRQKIRTIKANANNSSKVVDENGDKQQL